MKSYKIRISFAVAMSLASMSANAAIITPTPTLNTPQNGASAWLFNYSNGKFESFSWNPVSGATFRFVVSTDPKFAGFQDRADGATCDPNVCRTIDTKNTSVTATDLANFWWKPGTYYWTVRANTTGGVASSWAPTRSFTTTTATAALIVSRARDFQASPQSMTRDAFIKDNPSIKVTWIDDTEADSIANYGLGLKNAVATLSASIDKAYGSTWAKMKGSSKGTVYDLWVSLGRPSSPEMRKAISNQILGYQGTDKERLTQLVLDKYNGQIPTDTRDAVLKYFGFRAQCKEWADRVVAGAGGAPKPFVADQASNVKPGMYAMNPTPGKQHAAIINAVTWTKNGPYARLSEANAGNGAWLNPAGEIPWLRTVQHMREIPVGAGQTFKFVAN